MTIEYLARLTTSADGESAESFRRAAETIGAWAGIGTPLSEGVQRGRRGEVTTETFGGDEKKGWRLRLSHPDGQDEAVRWTVTVTALLDESLAILVRLDRNRIDGTVLPPRGRGGAPGCIRALLNDSHLVLSDGGRELASSVWVVDAQHAAQFAELVMSPVRRLPVFALTVRDEDAIDGGEVLDEVIGCAHVVLLYPETSWALDEQLPRGLNVYGGAARLYWPGVTSESSKWDHPLWTSDVRARRLQEEAVAQIRAASQGTVPDDGAVFLELERSKRTAATSELLEELERLRSQARERVTDDSERAAEHERSDVEQAAIAALQVEIEEAYALAEAFRVDADQNLHRALAAESRALHFETEAQRLRQAHGDAGDLEGVEEERLKQEIDAEVASRGEVEGAMVRPYRFGDQFLDRLANQGPAYRGKAIKACADVVMNAPGLLRRREDHALRTGSGGNDPQVVRPSDGAGARRCALEVNTPSARRVHYWALGDGSVEFATVNLHDDMKTPE